MVTLPVFRKTASFFGPFKTQAEIARRLDSSIDSVVEKQDHTMPGRLHPLHTHMSGRTG